MFEQGYRWFGTSIEHEIHTIYQTGDAINKVDVAMSTNVYEVTS